MKSPFDYPEVEGRLKWEAQKYEPPQANWFLAYTVLTSAENLFGLHEFVNQHGGEHIGDGMRFQHFLMRQGSNALESLYWLTKHHQYNAARDRVRYLYETFLTIRGLNADQDSAAEKWKETREEAREVDAEPRLKPLERQTDTLHTFRKTEKKRVEKEIGRTGAYKDFYRLLSDRGAHPASMRSSWIDGRYSPDSEHSQFVFGLVFAFGLAAQYVTTFAGTPLRWPLQERADQIVTDVKLAIHPRGLPTMFRDELFFWEPWRVTSPV